MTEGSGYGDDNTPAPFNKEPQGCFGNYGEILLNNQMNLDIQINSVQTLKNQTGNLVQ